MIELIAYQGLIRNWRQLAEQLNVSVENLPRHQREEALMRAAYEQWGTNMGLHINGQFACVLRNPDTDTIFAVRDVLGAEILFYYVLPNGQVLCATRIRDLLDQPQVSRELNEPLLQFYLGFTYVPGEETLFKGIMKLEPGGYLTCAPSAQQDGNSQEYKTSFGRYFELTFDPDESKTLDEWAQEISDAMDASMADICDADEQPDSFLSGGVDSSYMLAKSRARTGYCVSYQSKAASEEDEARETALYLGRDFEGIEVSPEQFFATIDEFLLAYEQPSSDAAGLSLYCACKQVRERTHLCFSGEGADEFFAGYNGYGSPERFEGKSDPVYYGATWSMRELDQKRYLKHFFDDNPADAFMRQRGAGGRGYDTVSWMLYVDLRSYFEGSILFNSTKISQGTGLDIRMPYCDLRIFDIARRMPSRFKVNKEGNKLALRKAASRVLPDEVAYRKKLGFPVPIKDWLANPAYNADILRAFDSPAAYKLFDHEQIKALLNMFLGKKTNLWHKLRYARSKEGLWRRVWSIYLLIRWYELFFEEA